MKSKNTSASQEYGAASRAEPSDSTSILLSSGSGKTVAILTELAALPFEDQRFALLVMNVFRAIADESEMTEGELRNVVYRVLRAGLLQRQKAQHARRDLAKVLGPSLEDLDPVPYATVEQARRLAGLRARLLRQGALSTTALADARGITANNVRQWVSRNRKAHRLFTVTQEGETLVPAFLLDGALEPRREAQEPIRLLREAGEDGWALWAWFATPSPWIGGRIPAELLATDPRLVAESARQRAASAA
jgi:hypothetical protein